MGTQQNITAQVKNFWNDTPCGTEFVEFKGAYDADYFRRFDEYRFSTIPSILEILHSVDFKGKRVLEIGLGLGADAQKIIEMGGIYNGVDLTENSVEILKKRFEIFSLPYESLRVMNAEQMSFEAESFDIVYSNGVLLTSPKIELIVAEIHRVLRKKGQAVIMLYYKNSLNYYVSIGIIRRLGIFLLFLPYMDRLVSKLTGENLDRLNKHKVNLKTMGLSYLQMKNFIHRSTDGPDNPYSSVWTKKKCAKLFKEFSEIKYAVRFVNKRHFPFVFNIMPKQLERKIEEMWGWNLWITVEK